MDKKKRKKLNADLRDNRNMKEKLRATREVMSHMPDMASDVFKIGNCSARRPCNRSSCDHCGRGVPHRNTSQNPVATKRADPKKARGTSKNYKSRGGQWINDPFEGFRDDQCHPFTINFSLEDLSMDGKKVTRRERRKFKRLIGKAIPGCIVRIVADIAAVPANTSCLDYPNDSIAPRFRAKPRPRMPAILFHGHGIIWHPRLSQDEIAKVFRQLYPGRSRVCFSKPKPTATNDDGYPTGGLEGWGEYASMEKTEVDFPDDDEEFDNVSVVKAMLRIRKAWPRSSRKIAYGERKDRVLRLQFFYGTNQTWVDLRSYIEQLLGPLSGALPAALNWSEKESNGKSLSVQEFHLLVASGFVGTLTKVKVFRV